MKKKNESIYKGILRYSGIFLIILFFVIEIYPVLWIVISSVKSTVDFNTRPVYELPQSINLINYVNAWKEGSMSTYVLNSILTVCPAVFLILVLSTTSSFAMSKMNWKFRGFALSIFLSGILIPLQVVLIPLVMIYKKTMLLDNLWSLILTYTVFGLPMSILLMVNYFKYLSNDIMESAVIDGCDIYSLFLKIVVPLSKNAIVTVVTIQFFFNWNDLIFSLTFINSTAHKTIQTGLLSFSLKYGQIDWGPLFAAVTISILPTLILYLGLNKLIIKGMTAGAVKG